MNNGITGDNDLNLALDVTAGQMNYSSITNSSTCFVVGTTSASLAAWFYKPALPCTPCISLAQRVFRSILCCSVRAWDR